MKHVIFILVLILVISGYCHNLVTTPTSVPSTATYTDYRDGGIYKNINGEGWYYQQSGSGHRNIMLRCCYVTRQTKVKGLVTRYPL